MGSFLNRLLGKKEPESFTISFSALPSWLEERGNTARSALLAETAEPGKKIRGAVQKLQQITLTLTEAEQDPDLHPKLKSIARNSLPQFIRAMNASLAKELPDEIDDFYPAAAECLKSCLNNTKGPGRYLQVVFPDEMKAIRTVIGEIGHEINGITASLTRYRQEKDRIDAVLALHTALLDIRTDLGKADEKNARIGARIAELSDRISAIDRELHTYSADERTAEVDALKSELKESEKRRDAAARTSAALSMTASHVFRKAEKIAVRQKHTTDISILRQAMEILSDHNVPDPKALTSALSAACPIAERMIAAGEISLKNKEERGIFSDTQQFIADICAGCTDLGLHEEACRIADEKLASHPLVVRIRSLDREKAQLETMLSKEQEARGGLEEWQRKTKEKIPGLAEDLKKKMRDLIGGGVQLQIDDLIPA
ncbi:MULTISPECIES: hypothetical protein [unclassified Methanoregula]|uniref:hypothetical protein n=1 Tax=unclassified Methanoregula TaxID=2649730 RepID=UPI0009C64C68|nr:MULTISPECIES: hypothetical protein [unclassified Methanoregula]OPX63677.1 MAG: hypothetical protein A4E33_01613 [Methanoregula sp. PtaB.Bin085]OPY36156.1 MAG: hypothetical protein A4E34_00333 [Methanoregula sp. PtaU1.Bin006]